MADVSDTGSTPVRSTIPCFDEHLSIKVFKTRIYLICGIRNPYEAESEKWQNSYQLSIGGVRKWVKRSYGLDISKSSVCSVRDKCGADKLEPGAAKIVPCLKTKKEIAVLEAFKALGFISEIEEQGN
ncbi:MAG: hypothetical protein BWY61_01289 [Firmicutes bacterium ADurb.Bin354]|nr:MAG: hypothetical protein BWY61_01289 [Firmicutes bacterium ADurb.Bin354]